MLTGTGICRGCVRNEHFLRRVAGATEEGQCAICNQPSIAVIPTDTVVAELLSALREHFEHGGYDDYGPDQPAQPVGEPAQSIIEDELGVPYDVATDLLALVNERLARDSDPDDVSESYGHVVPRRATTTTWRDKWTTFENRLKHESRFLTPAAAVFLAEAFDPLDLSKTPLPGLGKGAVKTIGVDSDIVLLRARQATSPEEAIAFLKEPAKELASPPPRKARGGRMNATGIPMFYGAFALDVALAEIRAPVGALAVVGTFAPTRNIRLLDLNNLTSEVSAPSIFSDRYAEERDYVSFLALLEDRVSEPVQPSDTELDYLATQAVAEYLRSQFGLDGMIYRSSQVGALGPRHGRPSHGYARCNVVLFRDASGVAPTKPDGALRLVDAQAHRVTSIAIASEPLRTPESPSTEFEVDLEALLARYDWR